MRTVLTLTASVVINVTALAALELSVHHAQLPPAGEVIVTQLPHPAEAALLAQVQGEGQAAKSSGAL